MDSKNPKVKDAMGRLFTARCLVEMANSDELPEQTQIHLATLRELIVCVHKELCDIKDAS